jgi:hypothetical protein
MNIEESRKIRLTSRQGKYLLRFGDSEKETAVRIKFARPLSARDSEISFLDEKKKEVAMVKGLHALDGSSRKVAEEALSFGYFIPCITRVNKTRTHFGTRFWDVHTDKGPRTFAMKDPLRNVTHMDDGRMVLRDTMGNCYEIKALEELDAHSQAQVSKII